MRTTTILRFLTGLIAALLCSVCTISARAAAPEISATQVLRSGEDAEVSFRIDAPRRVVRSGYAMVMQPVITDGRHSVSLPAILIRGRRAERLDARYEWVGGEAPDDAFELRPGGSMMYSASVEHQPWMEGAELRMEAITMGCCSEERAPGQTLAQGILPGGPKFIEVVEEPVADAPKTMGDMLARTFPFVVHDSEYDPARPIYDEDREEALIVYFRLDSKVIDPEYSTNPQMLANLSAAVQAITTSPDSRISRVVVAGFASPEGGYGHNDRLAWDRAVALKHYIMRHTDTPAADIDLHNGSEDWRGLRMLVEESDISDVEKRQVLDVLSGYPVLSSDSRVKPRLRALRELNGGTTYRYLRERVFPQLRSSAFIKVYYTNIEK